MRRRTLGFVGMAGIGACLTLAIVWAQSGEQKVWGDALLDVALGVWPSKGEYKVGEEVEVSIKLKNAGDKEIELRTDRAAIRVALFHSDGRPVARATEPLEFGCVLYKDVCIANTRTISLLPQKEFARNPLLLNTSFKIDQPDTYYVVVMHQMWQGERCFLVSNLAQFRVVGK